MKALVYHGPGKKSWEDVPDPTIQHSTDVIVKMVATTICGTDLHILKGDVPEVTPGRILGHEGIGEITEIGDGITQLKVGDRVILSCVSACGVCSNCRQNLYSHCLNPEGEAGIGWIFGHLIDGTQAEYVRVPFAENSVYKVPEGVSDAEGILISDILPTGFEIGVQYGQVKPGDIVAVIGAGPVGLAAVMTSQLYGPSRVIALDLDDARLARAKDFGATDTVNSGNADWKERVLALTDGDGVDVAIEAVGVPQTFTMALDLIRPGGHVANVGVHGKPVEFALNELWIRNITVSTGLVNTNTSAMLLKLVTQHRLPVEEFVTHEFSFDQIEEAYEIFGNAAKHDALKVLIH
ncbi:zinc-dependent alcohol dehydrogenase family protein [Salinibacterium sp. dk2585]|uniref:zinc-dependent alcohol dehydrogenase family protein n=1 Tax=unclassified Salinibacterium TaxID=2632331 RepID=UPI0011C248D8|nr:MULTISPECIES: zinc-dependent alcohol dehydrogenase family protein [unclassified Salinibacterium]QEE61177.1 zinc-dependent alcohol dehydrogenase family protein [Salinibacterium sp. dk2585]TXK53852.1 zinc-dependent alcohol dehydrogenase family protein [Salinibacterium sp. dk5596]